MDYYLFKQESIQSLYEKFSSLNEGELLEILYTELKKSIDGIELVKTDSLKNIPNLVDSIRRENKRLILIIQECSELFEQDQVASSEEIRSLCVDLINSCSLIVYISNPSFNRRGWIWEDERETGREFERAEKETLTLLRNIFHFSYKTDSRELNSFLAFYNKMPDQIFGLINKYEFPAEFISDVICSIAPILAGGALGVTPACITALLTLALREYIKLLYKEQKLLKYGPSRQMSRPNYNLFHMGMQMGHELIWKKDRSIRVQILTEKTVLYDGKEIALGRLTATLNRSSSKYLSPGRYWLYEDRLFKDIYDETYPPIF